MTQKSVFLDTSFLVASQLTKHQFFERTKELRLNFLSNATPLYTSYLVFDEFWYVLLGILRSRIGSDTLTIYNLIQKATTNVFSIKGLNLINPSLLQKDLTNTLKIMYRYKLRPRDALIVTTMKTANIKLIASFDADFDIVPGITRIY
ncbi:MAG: type II toxin-antitoxin system VapC family toxin [Patescibacteria group bacterium]